MWVMGKGMHKRMNETMISVIGYKESDVGRMTKTIETKVWRYCAQTTLMNKTLRRTDQGDASSSDWLDRKGIRGI